MRIDRLVALASGRRMGFLEHAGTRITFTYAPDWREAPGAYPLLVEHAVGG
jgi:hypothetical protein